MKSEEILVEWKQRREDYTNTGRSSSCVCSSHRLSAIVHVYFNKHLYIYTIMCNLGISTWYECIELCLLCWCHVFIYFFLLIFLWLQLQLFKKIKKKLPVSGFKGILR